jgi:DTW domain-containing protein YfiP
MASTVSDASATSSGPRCPACRQDRAGCWCAFVVPRAHRARVVLLQHPREARNAGSTARMVHLALPGSELLVGVNFENHPRFRARMDAGEDAVALFLADGARPVAELAARSGPLTMWVVDGTWTQAKKIWRTNPSLSALPAYRVDLDHPSRYAIRRSDPAPSCLATVEAVAAALDAMDAAPGRHQSLLAPLVALIARRQAHARSPKRTPRYRR